MSARRKANPSMSTKRTKKSKINDKPPLKRSSKRVKRVCIRIPKKQQALQQPRRSPRISKLPTRKGPLSLATKQKGYSMANQQNVMLNSIQQTQAPPGLRRILPKKQNSSKSEADLSSDDDTPPNHQNTNNPPISDPKNYLDTAEQISAPTPLPLPLITPSIQPTSIATPLFAPSVPTPLFAPSVATPLAAPIIAPLAVPITAPIAAPIAAPITTPINAPIALPIAAPNTTLFAAPNTAPNAAPITTPINAPIALPIAAPNTTPFAAPNTAPIAAPITAPNITPFAAPNTAPIAAPITAPNAPSVAPFASVVPPQQQQLNQAQLLRGIAASQQFPQSSTLNDNFISYSTNANNFLNDFNNPTDPPQYLPCVQPSVQPVPPPQETLNHLTREDMNLHALSLITNTLQNIQNNISTQQPRVQKPHNDILGTATQTMLRAQVIKKGYPTQRLSITSNRAHRDNKNLAPSEKKLVSVNTAGEAITTLQTMQQTKVNYINKLQVKHINSLNVLNYKLCNSTITKDEIIAFLSQTHQYTTLLIGELADFLYATGLFSELLSFTKLKESSWILRPAFNNLVQSEGREFISKALINGGIFEAIRASDVAEKVKTMATIKKPTTTTTSAKRRPYCNNLRIHNKCFNTNKDHRAQYYHPKQQQQAGQAQRPGQASNIQQQAPIAPRQAVNN